MLVDCCFAAGGSVPGKFEAVGQSVVDMKKWWVGWLVEGVGSAVVGVLAISRASKNQLNRSDHFWLSSSILASVKALTDLLSAEDLAGLSVDDLADLHAGAFSFSNFFSSQL